MSTVEKQVNGFVLAGGKSSRMGEDKSTLELKGKMMISYSIEALQSVCQSVSIISNSDRYAHFIYPVYRDDVQEKGPLAGILTGLRLSDTDFNLFVSCDVPAIQPSLLSYLIEQSEGYDAVVPYFGEKGHPLVALYSKNCIAAFENCIAKDQLKMMDAIEKVKINKLQLDGLFDERTLSNINTMKEFLSHAG